MSWKEIREWFAGYRLCKDCKLVKTRCKRWRPELGLNEPSCFECATEFEIERQEKERQERIEKQIRELEEKEEAFRTFSQRQEKMYRENK